MLKKKDFHLSTCSFIDWRNPTILVYKNFANVTEKKPISQSHFNNVVGQKASF